MVDPLARVRLAGTLAFRERARELPPHFAATLMAEPQNRYNPRAVAVHSPDGAKIGYLPPDIARHYHDGLAARAQDVSCPARTGSAPDEGAPDILLDLTGLEEIRSL